MNITSLKTKYTDWSYLTSPAFNLKAKNYNVSIGTEWPQLKPFFAITDMLVYGINTVTPPPTDLRLIRKIMSRRPSGYTYIDKSWLVLYTIEWADYLHRVLNVPVTNIWVLCDTQAREDVCLAKGYNIVPLSLVSVGSGKLLKKKKELKKIMKREFDNIVGNPPFDYDKNSNFYIEFIKLSNQLLKREGHFDFVMPNRFLGPKTNASKAIHKWLEATYVLPSVNHYFNIGTEVGVLSGVAKKEPKFNDIPFEFPDGSIQYCSLKNPSPVVDICPSSFSITDKIINSPFKRMKVVSKDTHLEHYVYIKVTYERWSPSKESGGPLRVQTMLNDVDDQTGHKVQFSSDEEAIVNKWFMSESKLGRFISHSFAAVSWSTSSLIHADGMPIIPVSKLDAGDLVVDKNGTKIPLVMTDQFLYDLFELSKEDIDHLEKKMISLDEKSSRRTKKKGK